MGDIPVAGPWITQREIDYVSDAATRCWGSEANFYHERFEAAFAEYVGTKHAIAVTHCTSAIHLSLAALNVGPGDEVILPDVTWIASAAPVSYVGATAVFADIDPLTWCLSAESFEANINERTRAVIAVDLYGNMPDLAAIRSVADRYGIDVIEDAAEAFGSAIQGRKAGSFGETGVFSFHGSKTMTTGEGGMLVTDRDDIRDRVLFLRDHGRMPGDVNFQNQEVAYKYRMSSMQAALGLAQVERAEELVARKREIFNLYANELAHVDGISLNAEPAGVRNSYWMTTLVCDPALGLSGKQIQRRLKEDQIDSRPFFHPLSSLPAYSSSSAATVARNRNSFAYSLSPRGLNLPSGMDLTFEQIQRVCRSLKSILQGGSNDIQDVA